MALTKKDKEEIRDLIIEVLASDKTNIELKQLDKKWLESGIKSETTGLIIAPEDVEANAKILFTWGEAMALEKEGKIPKGWRLPTRHEWTLIAEEFGQDENGELRGDVLGPALNLRMDSNNFYWSSTDCASTGPSAYACYLYYYPEGVHPKNNQLKSVDCSVRCVKEIENDEKN